MDALELNLFAAEHFEYTQTPCAEPMSKFMHIYE